jgi:hypothetical protein
MLVVNPAEAEAVSCIFTLFRELGCIAPVNDEADYLGRRTKCSTTANDAKRGGKALLAPASRLSNPISTGQIAHKSELHPGQHPALIDNDTWTAVRNQLAAKTSDHQRKAKAVEPSLLASLLVDARGSGSRHPRPSKKPMLSLSPQKQIGGRK